jgi:hypothetical protein
MQARQWPSSCFSFFLLPERNKHMHQVHITPTGLVRLILPEGKDYKRSRTIGQINGDTYIVERSENCIMRAFDGSIGFNYELMRDYRFTNIVVYFTSGRMLRTQRQTVLDYGLFLHFKSNKLERQIFLSLSDFDKLPKVKAPVIITAPRPAFIQENLFAGVLNG